MPSGDGAYRVFITHAGRPHVDRTALLHLLESAPGFRYSDCTPARALSGGAATDEALTHDALERQIARADVAVVLAAMLLQHSSRELVRFQVETARRLGKPILVLTPYGTVDIPRYLEDRADAIIVATKGDPRVWETAEVVSAIVRLGDGER